MFAGTARPATAIPLLSTIFPFSMRSLHRADPLDPGTAGFAHRGLHSSVHPENGIGAFTAALEAGTGIECDLGLTADKHVVIFHDRDARRMFGSSLAITSSKWSHLSRLGTAAHRILTLESLLDLVGGRVPLLLDVKVRNNLWAWTPALSGPLSQYRGRFGVMSFDPLLPRLLRTMIPDVRCGLVIRSGLPAWKRETKMRLSNPDFIAVERTALASDWVRTARQRMPVYAWTIKSPAERAEAGTNADALIWSGSGRPRV